MFGSTYALSQLYKSQQYGFKPENAFFCEGAPKCHVCLLNLNRDFDRWLRKQKRAVKK